MLLHVRKTSREREKPETARLLSGASGVGEKYGLLSDDKFEGEKYFLPI